MQQKIKAEWQQHRQRLRYFHLPGESKEAENIKQTIKKNSKLTQFRLLRLYHRQQIARECNLLFLAMAEAF